MDYLTNLMEHAALQYPALVMFLTIVGVLRSVFKPLMSLAEAFVAAVPNPNAKAELETFEKSKIYAAIVWVVDFLASVKLPQQKAPVAAPQPAPTPAPAPVGKADGPASTN